MIVAGAALFALCAVQAGKANSTLDKEIRELRAEKRDLLDLVGDYRRCGTTGMRKAAIYESASGYRVVMVFNRGKDVCSVCVKEFPYGDDEDFALLQAEELRDKINEK